MARRCASSSKFSFPLALILAGLLLGVSPGAAAQVAADQFHRTVTVSATGKMEAVPDRAVLPVEIQTHDRSLLQAKQKNDRLTDRLLKVTADHDIPKEKLKTSGIYISPQYRWEDQRQIFENYQVSRSIEITIDDLDKLEKLIAAITEAGIDQVQGVQFTIANPEALESAARKQAMQHAAARAEELAAAAGAKLGKVLTITLGGEARFPMPVPMRAMAVQAQAAPVPPPLPGVESVEQSVTVVYELE